MPIFDRSMLSSMYRSVYQSRMIDRMNEWDYDAMTIPQLETAWRLLRLTCRDMRMTQKHKRVFDLIKTRLILRRHEAYNLTLKRST